MLRRIVLIILAVVFIGQLSGCGIMRATLEDNARYQRSHENLEWTGVMNGHNVRTQVEQSRMSRNYRPY